MLAFYPRNGAFKEEGCKPKCKALEQAHMADHVLAQVSSVYLDFCSPVSRHCVSGTFAHMFKRGGAADEGCEEGWRR